MSTLPSNDSPSGTMTVATALVPTTTLASDVTLASRVDPSSPAQSAPKGWMPALDGVRALAVASVICLHLELPGLWGGKYGVTAFFVLSGYLITSGLIREHDRHGRIALRAFWARRARRLVPALTLVLALGLAITLIPWRLAESHTARPGSFLLSAMHSLSQTLNLHLASGQVEAYELVPTWSLNVEEQFYLAWAVATAVICWQLARRNWGTARIAHWLFVVTAVVGATSLAWSWWLAAHGASSERIDFATDTQFGPLLIGAALALAGFAHADRLRRFMTPRRREAIALVAVVAFAACLINRPVTFELRTWGPIAITLATAALIFAITTAYGPASTPRAAGLLAAGALVWIGRRSYAIYLVHVTILQALGGPGGWLSSTVVIATTMLLAGLSYRFVEAPMLGRAPRWWRSPGKLTSQAP